MIDSINSMVYIFWQGNQRPYLYGVSVIARLIKVSILSTISTYIPSGK